MNNFRNAFGTNAAVLGTVAGFALQAERMRALTVSTAPKAPTLTHG